MFVKTYIVQRLSINLDCILTLHHLYYTRLCVLNVMSSTYFLSLVSSFLIVPMLCCLCPPYFFRSTFYCCLTDHSIMCHLSLFCSTFVCKVLQLVKSFGAVVYCHIVCPDVCNQQYTSTWLVSVTLKVIVLFNYYSSYESAVSTDSKHILIRC